MSSSQWYYRLGDAECGPVATDELLFLKQSGSLTSSTSVREDGTNDWISLRETGLLLNNGKRTAKPDGRLSPPAQFRQSMRSQSETVTNPKEAHAPVSRQPAPLPPLTPQDTSHRNQKIFIGSLAGILVLMVLAWLLWPTPDVATGIASSGTGDGASDSGAEQSANEHTKAETDENSPTSAPTSGTDVADVGAAESAEAVKDAPPPPHRSYKPDFNRNQCWRCHCQ